MKVLVLGGTGAMGVHLVHLLDKRNVQTVVTTRSKRKSQRNIRYIQGNAQNLEFIHNLLEEHWDVIIDFMIYTTYSFRQRIELLLKATSQYVFISSARVYADCLLPINEKSSRLLDTSQDKDYLLTDEYALTKARQEDILKETSHKNWTIIRPYITYDKNRLQLGILEKEDWLYRALNGRTIVFSEDINQKITTLTYGLDVSKGIAAILGNKNALGEVFHITTQEALVWKEVLAIYLTVLEKHLGYKPKVQFCNLDIFTKIQAKKYQILYDRLFNRQFDNSKIAQYLTIDNFLDVEDGLCKCLKAFLENPEFKYIDWRKEAMKDRITKETASLKSIPTLKQKAKYLIYRYLVLL